MSFVAVAIGGGALLGFGGSLIAANGAQNAADTQASAANNAANLQYKLGQQGLGLQQNEFNTQQQELAPYLQSGYGALANLNNLLGLPNSSTPLYNPAQAATSSTSNLGQFNPSAQQPYGANNANYPHMPNAADTAATHYFVNDGGTSPLGPTGGITAPGAQPQGNSLASLVNPSLGATGSLNQGWNQTFQAPTGVTQQNDPGYQFRLQQGQLALEQSAAAKGNLLTGGTAKDLTNYAQGAASNEYQNVYNRALEGYQTNYNTFANNQANQYNRLASMAGVGQTTAAQLGQLGNQAAGNSANILLNTGSQVGNSLNNAGAARASGYVGSSNALASGLSGAGSNLMQGYFLNNLMNKAPGSTDFVGGGGA